MPARTNMLLTESQLENVAKWQYKVLDGSVSTKILTPLWNRLAQFIPPSVAPNAITLAALACVLQAYWIVEMHGKEWPKLTSLAASMLTYAYFTLDALDGKHARNTKNGSPLGELFDHGCDNIGAVFQILTLLSIMGVKDTAVCWYVVQAGQLAFLSSHISPFNSEKRTIVFNFLSGPGEVLHATILIMVVNATVGLGWLWKLYVDFLLFIENFAPISGIPLQPGGMRAGMLTAAGVYAEGHIDADAAWRKGVQILYYAVWWGVVTQILFLKKAHNSTRVSLIMCLLMRVVPAIVMEWTTRWDSVGGITPEQIVSDGLFLSILTSDIIVAKIADRELHYLVVVMSMMSVVSNFSIYFSLVVYYIVLLMDICSYMNLPLLSPVINVYCDGVFDMPHLGHMNQFKQALQVSGGTRLFVGIHTDKECSGYKRPPIMKEQERYATVRACKFVYDVIEGAPMVATKEFIDKHKIHIYAVGEEYTNNPDDHFYKVPRELGMLRSTKRSPGVSTSELIRRIQDQRPEMLERKEEAVKVDGCV